VKLKPILCFCGGALLAIAGAVLALIFLGAHGGLPQRWQGAYHDLGQVQQALLQFKMQHAVFPDGLDALETDYFPNGVPTNPYTKEAYVYITNGRSFSLIFYGKSDAPGGEDPPERNIVYTEAGCQTPYN